MRLQTDLLDKLRGAGLKVEAESQFGEQLQFKIRHQRRRRQRRTEAGNGLLQKIEHRRVRIALRQQPAQRRQMLETIQGMGG